MNINDKDSMAGLHEIFCEPLSSQEKDIAIMYSVGMSVDYISDEKRIKPDTVRKHLTNIKEKMGGMTLGTLRAIVTLRILIRLNNS